MKRRIKQFILLLGDIAILYISLFLALSLRHLKFASLETFEKHLLPFSIIYFIWLIVLYINDLYTARVIKEKRELVSKLATTALVNIAIATTLLYIIPYFSVSPKTNLFLTVIISSILIIGWRFICNRIVNPSKYKTNILLIGFNSGTEEIAKKINSQSSFGYKVKESINESDPEKIKELINKDNISTIVVKNSYYEKAAPDLYQFIPLGIEVYNFSTFWEQLHQIIPVTNANKAWFLEHLRKQEDKLYITTKRVFDITLSLFLGLISLIFYPFIIIAIKITSPGPIFYRQTRVGKNNKKFKIIKFRTMIPNAEKNGAQWASKNDSRITLIGKLLRKTRLDEIPQFLNILKGDLSFVGPRPERPQFTKKLTKQVPHYHLRHMIKPGLTGWAQIKYPYGSSVKDAERKLCYDLFYLKNRSFVLDIGILLKTIAVVLSRKGQ